MPVGPIPLALVSASMATHFIRQLLTLADSRGLDGVLILEDAFEPLGVFQRS